MSAEYEVDPLEVELALALLDNWKSPPAEFVVDEEIDEPLLTITIKGLDEDGNEVDVEVDVHPDSEEAAQWRLQEKLKAEPAGQAQREMWAILRTYKVTRSGVRGQKKGGVVLTSPDGFIHCESKVVASRKALAEKLKANDLTEGELDRDGVATLVPGKIAAMTAKDRDTVVSMFCDRAETWRAEEDARIKPFDGGADGGDGGRGRSAGVSRGTRPGLDVTSPADANDALREMLGTGPLSGFFKREGDDSLVFTARQDEEGYKPPCLNADGTRKTAVECDEDGPAQTHQVKADKLVATLDANFWCYSFNDDDEDAKERHALFPLEAAKRTLGALQECKNLKVLRGVTHVPLLRPDGTVLSTPGFDGESGFLYLPTGDVAAVPMAPTGADVVAAVELIDSMLCGFSFVTPDDKAAYLAAMLLPLLRLFSPPPYKMTLIDAHQPGSGKTLLFLILKELYGAVTRGELPSEAEELRKQIFAILDSTTAPVVGWDNVEAVIESPILAGLLTSDELDDRVLGVSLIRLAKNNRIWVVTGNNIQIAGDMARRTVRAAIDPNCPNPELRPASGFRIPKLQAFTKTNRSMILCALLTICRSWVLAGAESPIKADQETAEQGYADARRAVNGILAHARFAGVGEFDTKPTEVQIGGAVAEWDTFLAAVHDKWGSTAWSARDVLLGTDSMANPVTPDTSKIKFDDLPEPVASAIRKSSGGVPGEMPMLTGARSLGMVLLKKVGRWTSDGLVLRVHVQDKKNGNQYRIEKRD